MKINIGCDKEKIEGYISVDINPDVKPDIIDDATKLNEFKDNSLEAIRAFNILEHIPQKNIIDTLQLWYNKIERHGSLELLVPDLKLFCVMYLADIIEEPWAFHALYASHTSDNIKDWHKSGFSEKYLKKILTEIGFKNIERSGDQFNCELIIRAYK